MLERLKELEAKATPGPWQAVGNGVHAKDRAIAGEGFLFDHEGVLCDDDDARLIAEMRNALPKLLALAEAAKKFKKEFLTRPREIYEPEAIELIDAIAALEEGGK